MEQVSQLKSLSKSQDILEAQLRQCFGRVVYSHKTHEKCADILQSKLSRIKLSQIVLSAITVAGAIGVVLGGGTLAACVSVFVSTALLALNMYTKNYDLGELSQKHRRVGADLWKIREKYLSLIADCRISTKPLEGLMMERDSFLEELHATYSAAPSTTNQAYKKAQLALKKFEDMTFSDEEIDAFLPKELKKI